MNENCDHEYLKGDLVTERKDSYLIKFKDAKEAIWIPKNTCRIIAKKGLVELESWIAKRENLI